MTSPQSDRQAARRRLWPSPVVLTLVILMCLIEAVLQLADHGLVGSARWRQLAYQYGAFWAGLLHDWQPNFRLQPASMFLTYSMLHGGLGHLLGNLAALLALGLNDAFRMFEQPEKSYSWWDYREFAFRRNRGLRIDHILVSEPLKPHVKSCAIDKQPRKNERPSDHVPVVVELG